MNLIETATYREMSERAANIIIQGINDKPTCVLGLSADPTFIGTYLWLSDGNRRGKVDFRSVRAVGLDEYVRPYAADLWDQRAFVSDKLLKYVNIKRENIFFPNGTAKDLAEEGVRCDKRIAELGGIDLLLISLGEDGGLGFHRPDASFQKGTHEVLLPVAKGIPKASPQRALALGLLSVMEAKKILLLVSGESKRAILDRAFSSEADPHIPASILQRHPDITVIYSKQ